MRASAEYTGLTAPAAKRQHTQHVQAAGANAPVLSAQGNQAEASAAATGVHACRAASLHLSQDANLQAAQPTDASSRNGAAGADRSNDPPHAAQEGDAYPSSSTAPPQQPGRTSQGGVPDNNTVLWEPLVVRVRHPHVLWLVYTCSCCHIRLQHVCVHSSDLLLVHSCGVST